MNHAAKHAGVVELADTKVLGDVTSVKAYADTGGNQNG